jgi:SAM-dependent methyltransferase
VDQGTAPYRYPDTANPQLLERIPLDARTVLDIGCGTGALAAAYKKLNPRVRYLGIELNEAAGRLAAERMDEVYIGDAEQRPLPFDLPDGVDCLIYGDVLEHMADPWALIRAQLQALTQGGTWLACMPNVEHWSLVAHLLKGTFAYEDSGLLDRTHLRWFSRNSMLTLLKAVGLHPVDVITRVFDIEHARAFVGALAPTLSVIGVDPKDYLNRAAPLQYVWRARRVVREVMTVVSTILPPVGGVSEVRVTEPMRSLSSLPDMRAFIWNQPGLPSTPVPSPGVFILHRPALSGPEGIGVLKKLLTQTKLLVTEFDDNPDYIPILQRTDMWNFRGVHAVQTTTEVLAEQLRQQNPEVAVFPNAIRALPEVRNFTNLTSMTLFFGGLNREGDWPPFVEALNAVSALAGDRLRFSIVHDQGLFDALQTPHKSFTPMCDYPTYLDLLSRAEISFMPLVDNPFNRSKSDLKFIEAASHRVAALASPVIYQDSIEDGHTGVLFRDADELRRRLMHMVANPAAVRAIGEQARAWVKEHRMLAYQLDRRVAWYHSLWERREALHAALLERMPVLAEG